MSSWDRTELADLLTTLRASAPDAETVCEGWQARHLVAHLYLRRHRPWQAFGGRLQEIADAATEPAAYRNLVDAFAAPVPAASPMHLMDVTLGEQANLVEYVVHHEDVRRGEGRVPSRRLPEEMELAVFRRAASMARLQLRSGRTTAGLGVIFVLPEGPRTVVRKAPISVAVTGTAADLALVGFGRGRVANVELTGRPEATATLREALDLP